MVFELLSDTGMLTSFLLSSISINFRWLVYFYENLCIFHIAPVWERLGADNGADESNDSRNAPLRSTLGQLPR